MGGIWPGFDDSKASWSLHRRIDARCGGTFEDTLRMFREHDDLAHPIPFVLIATWNDYEEGTAIEGGIHIATHNQPPTLISKVRFMTDNNQIGARMFESLAILHLSQGATDERAKAALRAEMHAIDRMTDSEFAEFLDFAEVQRTQIRTLQILAAPSINFSSERRLLIQQQLMEKTHAAEQAIAQLSRVVGQLTQRGIRDGSHQSTRSLAGHWQRP